MASDDSNKENLGKQTEQVEQKMEEVEQKMEEESNLNSDLPWYLNDKPSKRPTKWTIVLPSAEEMARHEKKMEDYLKNPDGKVRPLRLMDRQKNLDYIQKLAEEDKLVKEAAQLKLNVVDQN